MHCFDDVFKNGGWWHDLFVYIESTAINVVKYLKKEVQCK